LAGNIDRLLHGTSAAGVAALQSMSTAARQSAANASEQCCVYSSVGSWTWTCLFTGLFVELLHVGPNPAKKTFGITILAGFLHASCPCHSANNIKTLSNVLTRVVVCFVSFSSVT